MEINKVEKYPPLRNIFCLFSEYVFIATPLNCQAATPAAFLQPLKKPFKMSVFHTCGYIHSPNVSQYVSHHQKFYVMEKKMHTHIVNCLV